MFSYKHGGISHCNMIEIFRNKNTDLKQKTPIDWIFSVFAFIRLWWDKYTRRESVKCYMWFECFYLVWLISGASNEVGTTGRRYGFGEFDVSLFPPHHRHELCRSVLAFRIYVGADWTGDKRQAFRECSSIDVVAHIIWRCKLWSSGFQLWWRWSHTEGKS